MQLYKGQTRAKPHGPALLQPDEPRTQSNPHNNYITMPWPGTATRRRQPRTPHPGPRTVSVTPYILP